MEENYKLLSAVLKELHKAGALKHLILAGSWCQYFYRILFEKSAEIPLLRTTDIDLLIPNPPKIHDNIDVPDILTSLGFDAHFDYKTGLIKYVHPDLEIQFLTPDRGRGKDTPYTYTATLSIFHVSLSVSASKTSQASRAFCLSNRLMCMLSLRGT